MKKFYYLLAGIAMVLVTIIACEKASIEVEELQAAQDEVLLEKGELSARPAPKVDICHWDNDLGEYYHLNISQNGWDSGHIDHEFDKMSDLTIDVLPADVSDGLPDNDEDKDGIADCADCEILENGNPDDSMKKTWYWDEDGDGYGTEDYIETCEPRGFDDYGMYYTATISGDCDDENDQIFPYSPVGDFIAISSGYSVWDISITTFDGTNFEGTGGFPSNAVIYQINATLTGTITNVNEFDGLLTWIKKDGTLSKHKMQGTVSECGGVNYLEYKWALDTDVEDLDGDKYYNNVDCDDDDPNFTPKTLWYPDTDGDGFGDESATPLKFNKATNGCDTTGYVLDNTDCDDSEYNANPGMEEICGDGIDNNCNGEIDENAYSPEGIYTIYRDNGAVLNITIHADGTITGFGYTSNGPTDPQTYTGTVTVYGDHTALLVVPQTPQGGTHNIDGIVSECDGITELTNDYSFTAPTP